MAATPTKPSPTNRKGIDPATGTTATNLTVAPLYAASLKNGDDVESTPKDATTTLPTYFSVESSDVYVLAKRHLNEGNFEEAMTVIEEGIRDTQELLQNAMNSPDGDFTLHESMAPFHYLYGTTLLYSIEEQDQEVTTAGSAVSTAVVSGEAEAANIAAAAAAAAAAAPEEGTAATEGSQSALPEDVADEMQIAWENFETARHIMETMLEDSTITTTTTNNNNNKENISKKEKLELDLAQICLREGDLQRMNGRNENAIQDYEACLKLRKQSSFLGTYSRKIADVHYNLGLVYINLASKDEETLEDGEAAVPVPVPAKTTVEDELVKKAKREMFCNKSVYHFLECCKCFSGQIASICGADPKSILDVNSSDLALAEDARTKANYKTTGEEDDEMEDPKIASAKLQTMRGRVTDLVSTCINNLTPDQKETVNDLWQLLEDIQETVDEAENSAKGVQEVTNMKAQVAALAAADGEIGEGVDSCNNDGGTTTIGFGSAATSTAAQGAVAAVPVVSAASTADSTAATARPMMVIKKKKRAAVQPAQEPDNKKPKAAE